MIRKIEKKKVYNAGKDRITQNLIHLHMCNHYRRILNAKKAVDNSPPYCYKVKKPESSKSLLPEAKRIRPVENLALTDRSASTNSNKDSSCGGDSSLGSSRYHSNCVPEWATQLAAKRKTMELLNQITYDTKNGPAAYCKEDWSEESPQGDDANASSKTRANCEAEERKPGEMEPSPEARTFLPGTDHQEAAQKRKFSGVQKKLKPSGVTAKGNKSFSPADDKSASKSGKPEPVSRLRSLRVYHPPRRRGPRVKPENSSSQPLTCALEAPDCKFTKICVCDSTETALKKIPFNTIKDQSVTSSRDSAYNGGVSSLPESRSPTPDQRRKKECSCCCCEKKQRAAGKPLGSSKQGPSPLASPPLEPKTHEEPFRKMQEDALYVKFIQDITTEILDKNLYTNKALKKVMKKHIKNNAKNLRKDRMLKEVENLRVQLGIPEDKTLLDLEPSRDVSYPVISDSEFVMPGALRAEEGKAGSGGGTEGGERRRGRGASESETEDNGEVVSVIRMMRAVRERRGEKGRVGFRRGNSSEESDRPSDPKKRTVSRARKQVYLRSVSSSSSDSERSGKFRWKALGKSECENFTSGGKHLGDFGGKSSFLSKKTRSVSFWKTPDLSLGRTFEMNRNVVIRGKESIRQEVRRDVTKRE